MGIDMSAKMLTDEIEAFNEHYENQEAVRTALGAAIIVSDPDEIGVLGSDGEWIESIREISWSPTYLSLPDGSSRYVDERVVVKLNVKEAGDD